MSHTKKSKFEDIFRLCRSVLDGETWNRLVSLHPDIEKPEDFSTTIEAAQAGDIGLPGFLADLARLEWALVAARACTDRMPENFDRLAVNPTLHLLEISWKNLVFLFDQNGKEGIARPEPVSELIIIWKDPRASEPRIEVAGEDTLFSLKMVVEGLDPKSAAESSGVTVGTVDAALDRAVRKGILIAPPSKVRRDEHFPAGEGIGEAFFSSPVFTLQWHITQACDLHCKHCYDRSERSPLSFDRAQGILNELYAFCWERNVKGQVSFSGGNPFLYPRFPELYRAASDLGFALAVLGNPVKRQQLEDLLEIEKPVFFQVSLEGLEEHNDKIRGPGHFRRTMEFLDLLRELRVYSMVMLTLTDDNMDQVIPLADRLRDRVDLFTFNRLSMFGEGAGLRLPPRERYIEFLERYLEASERNPVIALKDNLFNILRRQRGIDLFGGCAGYGCGAAFNFLALLPDGEVHACRKLPSLIGNVYHQGLSEIYDSGIARRYRGGCKACGPCSIRPVCGGCLAVACGHGLDMFEERDPYCFVDSSLTCKG